MITIEAAWIRSIEVIQSYWMLKTRRLYYWNGWESI